MGRDGELAAQAVRVRAFSRFYTQRIGALQKGHLDSPYALAEVRVLYELVHRDQPTATDLARDLDLDAGYLSRILRRFEREGVVEKRRAAHDGRQSHLCITRAGRAAMRPLEARSQQLIEDWLSTMSPARRRQVVAAMATIEGGPDPAGPYTLRPHRVGDMGWVIQRHGEIYAEEFGWNAGFEAMVAEIAAKFIRDFDPATERSWIAERDGQRIGCVFVVRKSMRVAKLRMLLVDPSARGLGLGTRLVDECITFARARGYRRLTLWTNDVLKAARALYVQRGFVLMSSEPHNDFGPPMRGEEWGLTL